MDCLICCEKLNKSTRKEIKCNYCEFICCRECIQKYLVEISNDPNCMNCKKVFTRDFLSENCTSVFIHKTLKTHRENILLIREKSLLPSTQPYVVVEIEKNKLRSAILDIHDQKTKLIAQVYLLDNQIDGIQRNINIMRVQEPGQVNVAGPSEIVEVKKFIRKCPMNECRGFLSTQWKCGVCETKICNKCNEECLNEHICLPNNVASMELLNKDTKPCPECGTMIFRISGCPQMFCTDCHCAWNWNTGKVEKGVIHNPHYYEFVRQGGQVHREHGDIPCGGLPDVYTIMRISSNKDTAKLLTNIHRTITHLQHYELRNHVVDENTINETNKQHRIKYLMNQISDDQFKKILQQQEKHRSKEIEFRNIFLMFVNVATDILAQMHIQRGTIVELEQMIILENLKNYFNDNIKKIGKIYHVVYPGINIDYTFINNYEKYLCN